MKSKKWTITMLLALVLSLAVFAGITPSNKYCFQKLNRKNLERFLSDDKKNPPNLRKIKSSGGLGDCSAGLR